MTPQEMDQLVRRANAAGFDSIADYAVSLETDKTRLMDELQALVDVFLEAPFPRAGRLLYHLNLNRRRKAA